ncbi:Uncharacterised protein [Klebsiella pneumoniae]|nr:Uncharacterised protein [Klebsiella pneumoniae]
MDRRAEGVEVVEADIRGQVLDRHRIHSRRQHRAFRQQLLQVALQHVREHRAKQRHADGAANRAEQGHAGGGDAVHLRRHRILHRQDQHLHHQPQTRSQHAGKQVQLPQRRVNGDAGQQYHAGHAEQGAEDRKQAIFTGTADNPPADNRGQQQAAHQRDQLQPGFGGRRLLHHLQIERQEGD